MRKIIFDHHEAFAVVINNIVSLLVLSFGGTPEQAELAGNISEGITKGIRFEQSILQSTSKVIRISITTALDGFEIPSDCKNELEDKLFTIYNINEYLENRDPAALMEEKICLLCEQFDECDITTLPADKIAEAVIMQLQNNIQNDHNITNLLNLHISKQNLIDNKEILEIVRALKDAMNENYSCCLEQNHFSENKGDYPAFITETNAGLCPKYQKREDLCSKLFAELKEKHAVNVYSMGGFGKTELVKEFTKFIQSQNCNTTGIHEIAWIQYISNNFISSLQKAFYPEITWMDFQRLCETRRERLLVIVDDIEQLTDEYIKKLVTLPCYVLLTSRIREIASFSTWELPPLSIEMQKRLFYEYYNGERIDGVLDKILELTANHTITIEFLAKVTEYQGWDLNLLLNKLYQVGFRLSHVKVSSHHIGLTDEASLVEQLSELFKIISYNDEEKSVLTYSSMIPNLSYTVGQAVIWFQTECAEILNKLYAVGMLESNWTSGQKQFWMHSIIAAAIRYQQRDCLYEKTKPFVMQMSELLETGKEWGYGYKKFYLIPFCWAIYDLLENKLCDEDDATFLMRLCYIALDAGNNLLAKSLAQKAEIIDRSSNNWYAIMRDLRAIGDAEVRLWNSGDAIDKYKEALDILKHSVDTQEPDYYHDMSAILHNLANVYQELSLYDCALDYATQSKRLQDEYDLFNNREQSTCLSSIAMIYLDMGDCRNAYSYIQDAINIQGLIEDTNSEDMMLLMYRADILTEMDYYGDALQDYERVKKFRETYYHEKHGDLADLYLDYSYCLCLNGDFEEGLSYADKAIEIYEHNDGVNSVRYLRGKNNKALILNNSYQHEEACKEYEDIFSINERIGLLSESDIVIFSINYVEALINTERYEEALNINDTAHEIYTHSQMVPHPAITQNITENYSEIYSGMGDIKAIEYYEKLYNCCTNEETKIHLKLSEVELLIRLKKPQEAKAILSELMSSIKSKKEYLYYYICCFGYCSFIRKGWSKFSLLLKIRFLLRKLDDEEKLQIKEQFL